MLKQTPNELNYYDNIYKKEVIIDVAYNNLQKITDHPGIEPGTKGPRFNSWMVSDFFTGCHFLIMWFKVKQMLHIMTMIFVSNPI